MKIYKVHESQIFTGGQIEAYNEAWYIFTDKIKALKICL